MEKRNVQISHEKAIEWYKQGGELREIALQAFTEEELTKPSRPHSWEEFCENFPIKEGEAYYIDDVSTISSCTERGRSVEADCNICTSEEEAEAFLSLMKLRQLRKVWVGDWKPDLRTSETKFCIINVLGDSIKIGNRYQENSPMSFPSKEMAEDFLKDFRALIESAKILL